KEATVIAEPSIEGRVVGGGRVLAQPALADHGVDVALLQLEPAPSKETVAKEDHVPGDVGICRVNGADPHLRRPQREDAALPASLHRLRQPLDLAHAVAVEAGRGALQVQRDLVDAEEDAAEVRVQAPRELDGEIDNALRTRLFRLTVSEIVSRLLI